MRLSGLVIVCFLKDLDVGKDNMATKQVERSRYHRVSMSIRYTIIAAWIRFLYTNK